MNFPIDGTLINNFAKLTGAEQNAVKPNLKAKINGDAWLSPDSDTSRHFIKTNSGRIAMKLINHLGDEMMKMFKVQR